MVLKYRGKKSIQRKNIRFVTDQITNSSPYVLTNFRVTILICYTPACNIWGLLDRYHIREDGELDVKCDQNYAPQIINPLYGGKIPRISGVYLAITITISSQRQRRYW